MLFAGAARAQDYGNFAQQYAKLVSQASDISALDERLFGDQVSLYTGALSFSHTDLSLPGSGFPMAVTRSLKVQDRGGNNRWALDAFGDWDLELPRHIPARLRELSCMSILEIFFRRSLS